MERHPLGLLLNVCNVYLSKLNTQHFQNNRICVKFEGLNAGQYKEKYLIMRAADCGFGAR
jgi:hypothetical protein